MAGIRQACAADDEILRPRTAEAISDPEFIRVKAHTLQVFKREMAALLTIMD